eukprot:4130775-Pleurochrysis_carterae.AAC.1
MGGAYQVATSITRGTAQCKSQKDMNDLNAMSCHCTHGGKPGVIRSTSSIATMCNSCHTPVRHVGQAVRPSMPAIISYLVRAILQTVDHMSMSMFVRPDPYDANTTPVVSSRWTAEVCVRLHHLVRRHG